MNYSRFRPNRQKNHSSIKKYKIKFYQIIQVVDFFNNILSEKQYFVHFLDKPEKINMEIFFNLLLAECLIIKFFNRSLVLSLCF